MVLKEKNSERVHNTITEYYNRPFNQSKLNFRSGRIFDLMRIAIINEPVSNTPQLRALHPRIE